MRSRELAHVTEPQQRLCEEIQVFTPKTEQTFRTSLVSHSVLATQIHSIQPVQRPVVEIRLRNYIILNSTGRIKTLHHNREAIQRPIVSILPLRLDPLRHARLLNLEGVPIRRTPERVLTDPVVIRTRYLEPEPSRDFIHLAWDEGYGTLPGYLGVVGLVEFDADAVSP